MDNVNPPQGQDPQQHQPTQPFRFTPGWPGGSAGYGQGPEGQYGQPQPGDPYAQFGPSQPGQYAQPEPGSPYMQPGSPYMQPGQPGQPPSGGPYSPGPGQPRRRRLHWGAGIAAVALLAAGGTVAGLKLAGNSSAAAPANAAQATALNSEINSNGTSSSSCQNSSGASGTSGTSSSTSSSSKSGKTRCHPRHLHLLRLVRGMYGEVAFHTSSGTETLAFERGAIQSVSDGHVVVRARNGTTWTWSLVSNSVVRKGGKSSASALAKGELVFVGGQATGSTKDIRLILVRPASGSQGSSSSQSSTSSSSSSE